MSKKFLMALMCVGVLLMASCGNGNNNPSNKSYAGRWLVNPSDFDEALVTDQEVKCWQEDFWCDGTVIGREYIWTTESALLLSIKLAMDADYKVHDGKYTKKYFYELTNDETETACDARVWDGAECWKETMTYPDNVGGTVTSVEYCWMPEKNMEERHDYYMKNLEAVKVYTHAYERTDINDKEGCLAQNPKDPDNPLNPDQPKDYSQYDNTTNKCWEATYSNYGVTVTTHLWMTERILVETLDKLSGDYDYHETAGVTTQAGCDALGNDVQGEGETACWKVTGLMNGAPLFSTYVWGPESAAIAAQKLAEEQSVIPGVSVVYEKSSANDEASCEAQNKK